MSRIAIIGTGISGLGAASLLHPHHDIVVYEKSSTIGGHTRTKIIVYNDRTIAVDTGFIVFNYRNYPILTALFNHLKVPVQKSDMTFAISAQNGALEWGSRNLNAIFGQRKNLFHPLFIKLLWNVLRFHAGSVKIARENPSFTMRQLLEHMQMSDWFARYFILPMGAAIWSCPVDKVLEFPALHFINFFKAHGLLSLNDQPQWYTVTGGSQNYVERLVAPFASNIRKSCKAAQVTRKNGKVQVQEINDHTEEYDHVIIASHADEALAMLQDATTEEQMLLSTFKYQQNTAFLHRDSTVMPKEKRCWSSWVYHENPDDSAAPLSVTYWMNLLQSIDNNYPLFVTLNPVKPIPDHLVFETHVFEHPIYSLDAARAQKEIPAIQGKNNTWFCGAYLNNGFHEDGLASAVAVARQLGAEAPWL